MAQQRSDKPLPTGPALIRDYVRRLPNAPGVYRMLGARDELLYVGKARNLKKRVANYTKLAGQPARIGRMILATAAMEFITTETETEALLLEANLIKRLKPRYNVLLRDDKSFPYILVRHDHDFPQVEKYRGAQNRPGDYYGPFASAGAVNSTLNSLQKAFLLRSCSDSVFQNRTRPCLLHQIKRCSAPCVGLIDKQRYAGLVTQAQEFLTGGAQDLRDRLTGAMQDASAALDFEQAALYRDRIRALSAVQAHQGINPGSTKEADVFAAYQQGGQTCIQLFFFRSGQNWGNRAYFPRADRSLPIGEILGAFIGQFYDNKPPPRLLLLSHRVDEPALLCEALSVRAGRKVTLSVPVRGEKKALVAHALNNAREALERKLAESASQEKLLQGLAQTLELPAPPRRIEVYDNSHIQGTHPVGAMIVAGPDGFQKAQYRKFNIRDTAITPGDDYAMMREVLTRRFRRLQAERAPSGLPSDLPPGPKQWPDLVIIDGGTGQLNVARDILAELGIGNIALLAVSKGPDRDAGRERFHQPQKAAFSLDPRDPVLYFLQRLRDEAHRFAIGSHRNRRKGAVAASPLDAIAGIGPKRKRALLNHFGSARDVSRAGLTDLKAVPGISAAAAQRIYDHFNATD